jgi:hypothetical protein
MYGYKVLRRGSSPVSTSHLTSTPGFTTTPMRELAWMRGSATTRTAHCGDRSTPCTALVSTTNPATTTFRSLPTRWSTHVANDGRQTVHTAISFIRSTDSLARKSSKRCSQVCGIGLSSGPNERVDRLFPRCFRALVHLIRHRRGSHRTSANLTGASNLKGAIHNDA